MHVPINVKSPNNISKWQMGFNSAFKWLNIVYREIRELKRDKLIWKQLKLLVQLIELKIYKYDNWQLVISSNRLTCCSGLTDCLNALWNGICISRD
jgi:hypothetical protein